MATFPFLSARFQTWKQSPTRDSRTLVALSAHKSISFVMDTRSRFDRKLYYSLVYLYRCVPYYLANIWIDVVYIN